MRFLESFDEMKGKAIAAINPNWEPRLLLVFTDETAVIVTEDTSGVYYEGEQGGMMVVEEPSSFEVSQAVELFRQFTQEPV